MKMEEMLEQLEILGTEEMEENFGEESERDEMRTDLEEMELYNDTKKLWKEFKKIKKN